MMKKKSIIVRSLLLLAFLILLRVICFHDLRNTDIFFHIRCGDDMLRMGKIITENIYAFTSYGYPVSNHAWLSKILFALVYRWGGFPALILLGGSIPVLIFFPLLCSAFRHRLFYVYYFTLVAGVLLMQHRFVVRPQLFSYCFFAFYMHTLLRYSRGRPGNYIYLLIPLQVIWNNMHAYSLLGPMLIGVFIADPVILFVYRGLLKRNKEYTAQFFRSAAWQRLWIVLLLAVCSYGALYRLDLFIRMYHDLFTVYRRFCFDFILEFLPTDITVLLVLFMLSVVSICYRLRRPGDGAIALLSYLLFIWALTVTRNIGYFVIMSVIAIRYQMIDTIGGLPQRVQHFFARHERAGNGAVTALAVWLTGIACIANPVTFSPDFLNHEMLPVDACRFINRTGITGHGFNEFGPGSYLTFGYADRRLVFIHNQLEAYDPSFIALYPAVYKKKEIVEYFIRRYKLTYAVIEYQELSKRLLSLFEQAPQWKMVYCGDRDVIFVLDIPQYAAVCAEYEIHDDGAGAPLDELRALETKPPDRSVFHRTMKKIAHYCIKDKTPGHRPWGTRFRQATVYMDCGLYHKAEKEYLSCLAERPDDRNVIKRLCVLYGRTHEKEKLELLYAAAAARGGDMVPVNHAYGMALIENGKVDEAKSFFATHVYDHELLGRQLVWLGNENMARGNVGFAARYFSAAIPYAQETAVLYYDLAQIAYAAGDYQTARTMLEEYRKRRHRVPVSDVLLLAHIYEKLGEEAKAQQLYRLAAEKKRSEQVL